MRELKTEINGTGEVKGKLMTQIHQSAMAYMYKCTGEHFNTHYEVFLRKEHSMYDMVSYPKSKSFGKWAWSFDNYDKALEMFNKLSKECT